MTKRAEGVMADTIGYSRYAAPGPFMIIVGEERTVRCNRCNFSPLTQRLIAELPRQRQRLAGVVRQLPRADVLLQFVLQRDAASECVIKEAAQLRLPRVLAVKLLGKLAAPRSPPPCSWRQCEPRRS